ncbi:MAG: potassium channel protein [Marinilabiliales bacterium]|nr:MAG: potassium channel protein [Marinilabiliales bacterium]
MSNPRHHLRNMNILAFVLVFFIIASGVVGYMLIENFSFLEALYMTIITIGTVGFKEVHTLSEGGMIFTVILIVFSLGIFAYALSLIASNVIEGHLSRLIFGYRIKTKLKKMENHVIICGFGRNGKQAVHDLKNSNQKVVIIDSKEEVLKEIDQLGYAYIYGDATEEDTLIRAGIMKAKAIISTFPNDADNLYVSLTAKSLNNRIEVISRASSETSEKKLKLAGIDHIITPEKVGGTRMAMLVMHPDLVEFLQAIAIDGHDEHNLIELQCDNLPDEMKHVSIGDLQVRKLSGANIIGIKREDGTFDVNPSPDTLIKAGTKLFVLGTPDQIKKMESIYKGAV